MKKTLDFILNLISILAPIPTGWAVYAGLTERSAWPMPAPIATLGAIALVAVTISISSFIVESVQYNQGLKSRDKTDGVQPISISYGWSLLGFAVLAEITLTLLIVIFPGLRTYAVIAFPLLSLAGMFCFVLRINLAGRIAERGKLRDERRKSKDTESHSESHAIRQRRIDAQKRQDCAALQVQYTCPEPACEWKPSLEKLLAAQNPEQSAVNARTAHRMHKHSSNRQLDMSGIRVDEKAFRRP
jgi:hypothetical protein